MNKKVVIPPQCCVYADFRFDSVPNFDLVISPCYNIHGLFSPNCITGKDQHVIFLRNSTDKLFTVKKN